LLRPAALVPAVNHKIINGLVNIALIIPHVYELESQRNFRHQVGQNVLEWIFFEKILILVEFGDIVRPEALLIKPNGGIIIDASLESSEEPVDHGELESHISHVN